MQRGFAEAQAKDRIRVRPDPEPENTARVRGRELHFRGRALEPRWSPSPRLAFPSPSPRPLPESELEAYGSEAELTAPTHRDATDRKKVTQKSLSGHQNRRNDPFPCRFLMDFVKNTQRERDIGSTIERKRLRFSCFASTNKISQAPELYKTPLFPADSCTLEWSVCTSPASSTSEYAETLQESLQSDDPGAEFTLNSYAECLFPARFGQKIEILGGFSGHNRVRPGHRLHPNGP